jgi:hypothetical protein
VTEPSQASDGRDTASTMSMKNIAGYVNLEDMTAEELSEWRISLMSHCHECEMISIGEIDRKSAAMPYVAASPQGSVDIFDPNYEVSDATPHADAGTTDAIGKCRKSTVLDFRVLLICYFCIR